MNNKIKQICFMCDHEVEIDNKYEKQECPSCGDYILPCNICTEKTSDIFPCLSCKLIKK